MIRRANVLGIFILAAGILLSAFDAAAAETSATATSAQTKSAKTSARKKTPQAADQEALGKTSRPANRRAAQPAAPGAEQKEGAPKIAVLPFEINAGPAQERLNDELPALLIQRLLGKGIAVVPDGAVIAQMRKDNVKTLNIQTARALAAKLGATAAVYGSYSQVGGAFSIDARFVETGEAQVVKPMFVERSDAGELLPGVDELATRISNELKRRDLVAAVEVRGTKVLDSDVVLMRINTRKGDPIDMDAIDREVKRIWDLGYFRDVSVAVEPREDGLHLVYTVEEKPRIESVVVEGAKEVDAEDITAAMGTKTGSVLNDKVLAEDLQKVRELYRKDGFYLANVDYRIDTRPGGTGAALVLTVNEGNKLYIKEVKVEGVKLLKESDIKKELALSERNILSWITGTGVLKEEMLERDSSAITAYYMNNGFIDVTVGAAKVDYADDGITVTFPVNEGERYRVGNIIYAGDLIDTDEQLRTVTKLDDVTKDNGWFNLSVMQNDTKHLSDYYAEYGYAFAEVNPLPKKREGEPGILDVTYAINKKQKVYIRRAVIEGNWRTRDNVILRELRLTDGDLFVGSKLQRSTQRLNKLGYFEVAEAELVPTQKEDEVDLKVKVKEKSTGSIMGGFGYSTYDAFGVTGTLQERNLWGKGYLTSLQALFSGRRTAYTWTFVNPRYNDTNLSVGFDLYSWKDDYYDYVKKTIGGTLRFAYPLGEYTSLGWGYRLDRYKLYDFDDDAAEVIKEIGDEYRWSSVGQVRITRDTTDRLHPTSGTINRIGVEYGGGLLGGDDDFIRLTAEHQTYYQLVTNHILHFRARGGAVFKNGSDDVPVFERFWMGGMDSVRGYASKDIVPRDPRTNDRIGGTRMAFANFEYIWSIAPEVGVNIVPFFDIGVNIDADRDWNWDDEIKRSFGVELRWRSPMGDLRFGYGIPLDDDRRGRRDSGRFEFSMGQFF